LFEIKFNIHYKIGKNIGDEKLARNEIVKVGDRIKLVFINDTWTELKPGDKGTVNKIDENQEIIWVDWDNGEQLALLIGIDKFKIIKK
jgi:hypothetical protein